MNQGLFAAQINDAHRILNDMNLTSERVYWPSYPRNPAALFRPLTYIETWKTCYSNRYYDFLLIDYCLLQFRLESIQPLRMSYAFLECPYQVVRYQDFVAQVLGIDPQQVGDEWRAEYEDYLLSCPPRETVTPIRYDYDPDRYTEGLHPASHVHFGFSNSIRIGTRKVLRPISFILLVVRQCYGQAWQSLLSLSDAPTLCRNVRDVLDDVDNQFVNPMDAFELMLG